MQRPFFIQEADVERFLPAGRIMEIVEDSLAALWQGRHIGGGKLSVPFSDAEGARVYHALVGILADRKVAGVKWVGTFAENPTKGLPRAPGMILLTDSVTGEALAVVAATALTAWRTAAMAVVGAKHCLWTTPKRAAVFGAGAIGLKIVELLTITYPDIEICVSSRNPSRLIEDEDWRRLNKVSQLTATSDPTVAVQDAEFVFTATGILNDLPFLDKAMLGEHAIVCSMGSYQEISDDVILGSDMLIADDPAGCQKRGNLAPLFRREQLAIKSIDLTLPELVGLGGLRSLGRQPQLTTIAMVGLGAVDVALACEVAEKN